MKNCAAIVVTGVLAAILAFPGAIKAESVTEPLTDEDFIIAYGDIEAALGDNPETLVEEIAATDEQEITVEEGYHNAFVSDVKAYNGTEITVQSTPAGEGEQITGIYIDTDTVSTHRGIGVGSTLSQVTQVYGKDYMRFLDTVMYMDVNRRVLIFQIDNNKVISYAILQDSDPSAK